MAFELQARDDAFDNSAVAGAEKTEQSSQPQSSQSQSPQSQSSQSSQQEERRLCVLHDVTESRRLQEQLLQSEKVGRVGRADVGRRARIE